MSLSKGLRTRFSRNYLSCIAAVCSLALLALVATIARWFHPGLPARVRFTENAVQALDAEGRRLCPGLRSNQPRLPRHYWDSDPTEGRENQDFRFAIPHEVIDADKVG